MKLWGGRFTKETNELVNNFNASISFDQKFYKQDIQGSIAHATMLAAQGIISEDEGKQITDGLKDILSDIESGKLEITDEYEDIHTFMEATLIERIGDAGKKLMPVFDSSTWTVLVVTVLGILFALTPFGKIKGTEEISNVMLYIVIALIASRADLSAVGNAPIWLLAGFVILVIHVVIMIILAKVLKMDIFTCCVASLANIGGTATAPVLAGAYSTALVPVGIIMALLGYVIGTGGGLIVANIMSLFG